MTEKYPEVVVGTYIFDARGNILLTRSPKWNNQWIIQGGHAEYGESIFGCAIREAKEEVGLDIEPIGVISIGEDIFPKAFRSKRHFIYFEVICKASSKKVRPDNRETTEFVWVAPQKAIKMVKQPLIKKVLRNYIRQKRAGEPEYIDLKPG